MARAKQAERVLRDLGRRIKELRVEAELTQEDAADRAGIDPKRWQRIEAGDANVTVKTLVRVAAALRVSFWKLMGAELP